MPPFVKKPFGWLNGREFGVNARWNADAVNDLEDRIATAVGTGVGGGTATEVIDQGTAVSNVTLDMTTHQDVLWVVTLGANVALEIGGWAVGKSVTLVVKQDATGNRTLVLPTAKWAGGAIPLTTQTSNAIDIRAFFRGTTETYGFESGSAMA